MGVVMEELGPRAGDDRDEESGAGPGALVVPDPGARPVRVSLGVHDRHAGHRDHPPPVSGIRAVGGPAGGRGGALVSMEAGTIVAFALGNLQERSTLFVAPGEAVYEGMIVGENSRPGDMDVNPTREKKLTNMRSKWSDDAIKLEPPRELTLEVALEYIEDDELIEVTPQSIRLRKRFLSTSDRKRQSREAKRERVSG